MREFINYDKSIEILNTIKLNKATTQKLFIIDAIGKVIANDVIADHNSPEFPTSGMDGYAIRFEDINNESITIIDKNPAGSVVESSVSSGVCIKTFTGSLMPKGSDTLVPIENVEVIGDSIKITKTVPLGFATRAIGENYAKNEVLIKKGTVIGFAEVGVLASLNIAQINVIVNPTVAIASTGSEILDLGEVQTNEAQIRSSNHLTIEALCKKNGANTLQMGIVEDDIESITNLLETALQKADIVVTTGGVSVGDYDFVQDVIKDKLNAKVLFHGVTIKPGMHILVAIKDGKTIIALPGFAYSSTVCAILYVLPLIYRFREANESLPIVKARISEDFPRKMPKTVFTACNVEYINNEYTINFDGKKKGTSAILTNMLENPAILIQKEDSEDIKAGDLVDILLLNQLK
ncbi:molybdopterin molybdotransferase MoeA [Poseidonibacter ostreae]|jgi:molybdopterin molybdotransferase|uniref:Molybdopterin molybdenumtransferase n=1 Tax=Poseidonibacter ostreae TaxID=2654171 RepID=A0A6L4WWN7_9BACT|nr:molybdopterin molybdotransferase MoeA [Poseidonibacter ostreae]KAB7887270.1 molybdopterin molybdenumtransferase MoeA [Poseidonibacter ostreae]KAB7890501.1 molybdopterin molybdenumtransferase MoeA [Poseidonibacter ostreae]KAB7890906.1 molybdopterin molybdenumtransferase MoeA [Poseidonibacter ostreae]MAC84013.1 molybdopterin molybdenumtransferase MoeA [Arcobacter sp.]